MTPFVLKENEGSAALAVIAGLLLLSVIGISLSSYTQKWSSQQQKILHREQEKIKLENYARDALSELADSPYDDLDLPENALTYIFEEDDGAVYTVELTDVSSRINLNHIDFGILMNDDLKEELGLYVDKAGLESLRESVGLSSDFIRDYGFLFSPEVYRDYMSHYGWYNIDVSVPSSLQKIYTVRTGSEADEEGSQYGELSPLINGEPLYNIYFLQDGVTEALVHYYLKDRDKTDRNKIAEDLIETKYLQSLTVDEIKNIIAPENEGEEKILEYLGTITWFWKCRVRSAELDLTVIACRLPSSGGGDIGRSYRIVESIFK